MGLLRVVLAVSVIAGHVGGWWPGVFRGIRGDAAVELFFVISGFYMALILQNTYVGRTRAFFTNRFLRIFPEYWLIALLTLVGYLSTGTDYYSQLFHSVPAIAQIVLTIANTTIWLSDTVMFLQVHDGVVAFGPYSDSNPELHLLLLVPQAWTLAVELCFYLLAPTLVRLPSRTLLTIAGAALTVKFAAAGIAMQLPDPWSNRFVPFELAYFILGILLNRVTATHRTGLESALQRGVVRSLVASFPVILFAVTPVINRQFITLGFVASEYFFPLTIVAIGSAMLPLLFVRSSTSRVDRRIGDYSYPLYVSHMFSLMSAHQASERLGVPFGLTAIMCIVAIAHLLVLIGALIERKRAVIRTSVSRR